MRLPGAAGVRRHQRRLCVALVATLLVVGGGGLPATASAASEGGCGVAPRSNTGFGGTYNRDYCSSTARTQWNYVSNSYYGGGSISRMRAGIFSGGNVMSGHRYANNATFVNSCSYGVFYNSYGVISQYEASGASHTLYYHVDDSRNHSHCFLYGV